MPDWVLVKCIAVSIGSVSYILYGYTQNGFCRNSRRYWYFILRIDP